MDEFDVDDALNDVGIDLSEGSEEAEGCEEVEAYEEAEELEAEGAEVSIDEDVKVFLIGDPHFKAGKVKLGNEYIEKCVQHAREAAPTFIVCLGDILDTNEVIRVHALKLAEKFLDELSQIAPTYLLIGNHDYINQIQYCTDNHGFGAFKKWPNLTIVDTVIEASHDGRDFVFCPYVPKGRFIEALDESEIEWRSAEAIFAHQEFRDCKMGARISDDGDEWDEEYPPVFSGHIHEEQLVGENVFYPGSSIQHGYGDNPDKKVWTVTFSIATESPFTIEKIDVGLRWKKLLYIDIADIKDFDFSIAENYDVKVVLSGEKDAITVFKKSQFKSKLTRAGVTVGYNPLISKTLGEDGASKLTKDDTSFEGVLARLLKTKGKKVQLAYRLLQTEVIYELEF